MTVVSFTAARKRRSEARSPARADVVIGAPPSFGKGPCVPSFPGATVFVEEDGTHRCGDDAADALVAAGLFERDQGGSGAIRPHRAVRDRMEALTRAARSGERPSSILRREGGTTFRASAGAVPLGGQAIISLDIRPLSPPEWSNRDLADEFGLTEREAEVTRFLLHGHPVPSIAARLQVRANTVRQYLKLIYAKTSTTGQAQLVAMLTGGFPRAVDMADRVRTLEHGS
jgi:DNA-binding CsgD family transcriptional regulator